MKARQVRSPGWPASLALVGVAVAVLPPRAGARVRPGRLRRGCRCWRAGASSPSTRWPATRCSMIRSQQSFRFEGWRSPTVGAGRVAPRRAVPARGGGRPAGLRHQRPGRARADRPEAVAANRYFAFGTIVPHSQEIQKPGRGGRRRSTRSSGPASRARCSNLYQRLDLYLRLENTVQVPGGAGAGRRAGRRWPTPGAAQRHGLHRQRRASSGRSPPRRQRRGHLAQRRRGAARRGRRPASRTRRWPALASGRPDMAQRRPRRLQRRGGRRCGPSGVAARPEAVRAGRPRDRLQPGRSRSTRAWSSTCWRCCWSSPPGCGSPSCCSRSAFALLVAGAVIHTAGLVSRIILQGRPPVTNLYSSAVFVGWGAVVLGVVLERHLPQGLRHRGGGRLRLRLAHRGAPPDRRRRHHGDDAGGARLQLLARDARRHHHHRLQRAPSWPAPSPSPGRCASTWRRRLRPGHRQDAGRR